MSLYFDSAADDIIRVLSSATLNNLANKTVACWIYMDKILAAASNGRLIDKRHVGTGFTFNHNSANNCIQFIHDFSTTDGVWRTAGNSFTTGGWYHVAVKYVRGSTANLPTFYINGSAQTTTVATQPVGTISTDATSHVLVGSDSSGTNSISAYITEVSIYSTLLSEYQVGLLATPIRGMPEMVEPSSLVLYLPLDEFGDNQVTSGINVFRDRSGTNNHGSVMSAGRAPVGAADNYVSNA